MTANEIQDGMKEIKRVTHSIKTRLENITVFADKLKELKNLSSDLFDFIDRMMDMENIDSWHELENVSAIDILFSKIYFLLIFFNRKCLYKFGSVSLSRMAVFISQRDG